MRLAVVMTLLTVGAFFNRPRLGDPGQHHKGSETSFPLSSNLQGFILIGILVTDVGRRFTQ